MPGDKMLEIMGWKPLELAAKEGLALLNGTQFMSALGVYALLRGNELNDWADVISALSVEGFDGRVEAYYSQVHEIRHHKGQIKSAANLRKLLDGSQLATRKKLHVQDPYSFRCIPQVHGATRDAISYVSSVFEDEINAVTDNPTIFPEDDLIISAGNFHGQPLAITLDFLGIAISELGNIAESRVYRLISGGRGLPPFLVANPGLNSGFMIPQYTAASILSQNKQFCTPSSVDSIESSQGQEDHVSMGANAAVKTLKIIDNIERILGIELMNASQAMGFRDSDKTSPRLKKLLDDYRKLVAFVENDKVLYVEMEKSVNFIKENHPVKYLDN
jgi:histidine ammonia-lyase